MKLRMIVLKKSSIRRTLALAVVMILAGASLVNPFKANAITPMIPLSSTPSIFYLYPTPQNNPILLNGMFWSEKDPAMGYATLATWDKVAKGKQVAIGIPRTMDARTLSNSKFGQFLKNKIKGATTTGQYDKDVFTYKRTITSNGVTDEVKVEVGRHFRENKNFEDFAKSIGDHLVTEVDVDSIINPPVPEIPEVKSLIPVPEAKAPEIPTETKAQVLGGSMLLGGLLLVAKVLVFAL